MPHHKCLKTFYFTMLMVCLVGLSACGGGGDDGGGGNAGGGGTTPTSFDPVFTGPDANGEIVFQSVTPGTYRDLVNGRVGLPQADVTGTLYMPQGVTGPVPAMVISHGSSGIQNSGNFYVGKAMALNNLGIAAFLIDSQTPRGFTSQLGLSTAANVADALIALVVLSQLPEIDPDRVGIIGYSVGGLVVVNTFFKESQNVIAPATNQFKAYIGYYPQCNIRQWSPNISQAPMLILHGEADEWDAYTACIDLVNSLNGVNANASIITYPGAHHVFDSGGSLTYIADARIPHDCAGETRIDTFEKRRFDTGQIFANNTEYQAYLDTCRTMGGNVGGDDAAAIAATLDAANEVELLLTDVFGL